MKKTQVIELVHTIRKTYVTFIAIILFVTMGMALFFGITWSADAIKESANDYLRAGHLADLDIQYVYGFDDEFIERTASNDNIGSVEGYYQAYEQCFLDGKMYEVRITSLTDSVNVFAYTDGTIPNLPGEIAVEKCFAEEHSISIGDTISFIHDTGENDFNSLIIRTDKSNLLTVLSNPQDSTDGMRYLTTDTFTVTAIVKSGPYLSSYSSMYGISYPDAIPISSLMFAAPASFDDTAFPGWTNIAVTLDGYEANDYLGDRHEKRDALVDKLSSQLSDYAEKKNTEISDKLNYLNSMGVIDSADFTAYTPYTSTSDDNASVIGLQMMTTIFDKLRYSMAGLFVIIGLLVCFFTVSRIVYENSVLIGTKKALGITRYEITRTYLLYAGFAAAIGAVCGALGARFIVEPILLPAIGKTYYFENIIYIFDFFPALLFGLFEIAVQMLTVFIACRKTFRKNTLSLLHGEQSCMTKKRFYEKTRLWKHLSLFFKTIINNFWNDKRRVLSTIIGVAACSSLVVCALTLNNHILGSFDRQYETIYRFDGILYYNTSADRSDIDAKLAERGISSTEVYSTYITLNSPSGKKINTKLFVVDKNNLSRIIGISDWDDGHTFSGGIWSSCSYAEEFDVKSGCTLTFSDANKTVHNVTINGFFEYYLINNLLITDVDTYCSEFGTDYIPNTLFIESNGYNLDTLSNELSDCAGFRYLSDDYSSSRQSFDGFADVFSIIVAVYLVLAIAMAFLVLLNLFIMFVTEKKREVLTLLVNGYSMVSAKKYIWLDTVCLAIVGIICGIAFGTLMAGISLSAYNNETLHFLSGFDSHACLFGVIISVTLTIATALPALKQIEKFKLTDINVI